MKKTSLLLAVIALLAVVSGAQENGVVSWKQVVGIIAPGNVVGSGSGAVAGGGFP